MRLLPALIALLVLLAACTSSPLAAAPTQSPAGEWWRPAPGATWQIQFSGEIDTSPEVEVYFLDLFETPASLVAALQAQGRRVVCYFSAGSWEYWRPDAADFPDAVIGKDYTGWPGERWLDAGALDLLAPIMAARLDLCAAKGFDGADPDNVDGAYNDTGFEISLEEQLAYNRWLAEQAHARGLAIGLKNTPELAEAIKPDFDWALTESCFAQGWCADLASFLDAGKPVFAIEYVEEGIATADFCAPAAELGISAILKELELGAWVEFCP
jgi:hypothetical protein